MKNTTLMDLPDEVLLCVMDCLPREEGLWKILQNLEIITANILR